MSGPLTSGEIGKRLDEHDAIVRRHDGRFGDVEERLRRLEEVAEAARREAEAKAEAEDEDDS
ncbi:MAG: hypothetical protein OXH68_15300 [Gammaproteobacteria bacterium]|nr:hypothetical protein [Gammaproteobacteria bacterium]